MSFKLWSDTNPKAKKELKPDLGMRSWDSLNTGDKYKIWKHLESYLFDEEPHRFHGQTSEPYSLKTNGIFYSIKSLNERYKVRSYAKNFLEKSDLASAYYDFYKIFMEEKGDVVIELLSLYCQVLISEIEKEKSNIKSIVQYYKASLSGKNQRTDKETNETEEDKKILESLKWEDFDNFSKRLNEVFIDFGINLYLTRDGFIPRQDKKITEEIYEPVINFLSNKDFKEVNRILSDAFSEYRRNTFEGYSNCITHAVSAIQAFLQIKVNGKTGSGNIKDLIKKAQKNELIPNDFFTEKIFDNMESIFARERQDMGIAHPKKEYSNEKNACLILNLTMVFIQHCIQK
ncbi:MAG: hypothetical protein GX445_06695 [Elusimicrobia bacterium]|nr:hypothetical protein [Elusimicrobiota bacterium]